MDYRKASEVTGISVSTLRNMVRRGEVRTASDGTLVDEDVLKAPKRGRGHPKVPAPKLRGAEYAKVMKDEAITASEVAQRFGISRQAVSKELQRYEAANGR